MSKLTALAEYVHTWAPIATQLLASDNDAVKMYGVKIQQEVDVKKRQLEAELGEAKAILGMTLATQPSQQKEVSNPDLVEHSTIHGCTETQVKTECTIEL